MPRNNYFNYSNYYYLLYKINSSPTLWIVAESVSFKELYKKIRNYKSNDSNYSIIQKRYNKQELEEILNCKFKRFQKFTIDKNCRLIIKTN
jgi:hypothetical protein